MQRPALPNDEGDIEGGDASVLEQPWQHRRKSVETTNTQSVETAIEGNDGLPRVRRAANGVDDGLIEENGEDSEGIDDGNGESGGTVPYDEAVADPEKISGDDEPGDNVLDTLDNNEGSSNELVDKDCDGSEQGKNDVDVNGNSDEGGDGDNPEENKDVGRDSVGGGVEEPDDSKNPLIIANGDRVDPGENALGEIPDVPDENITDVVDWDSPNGGNGDDYNYLLDEQSDNNVNTNSLDEVSESLDGNSTNAKAERRKKRKDRKKRKEDAERSIVSLLEFKVELIFGDDGVSGDGERMLLQKGEEDHTIGPLRSIWQRIWGAESASHSSARRFLAWQRAEVPTNGTMALEDEVHNPTAQREFYGIFLGDTLEEYLNNFFKHELAERSKEGFPFSPFERVDLKLIDEGRRRATEDDYETIR